jgi:[protein-PII] uridylyltransferase
MRLMNQTSVLGRYLWVFRRIVGQMQHDLFHVYTVDQHILMVLRNVRRFFMAEHAHEYPFCSQLAAGWDKPWVLYVAALFHDIAKGRGGDHSELGAREVRRFCRQHGVRARGRRLIEFLVREHLTMSRIAQKEDLSDPEVIPPSRAVGNERYLTALYLLTVADIRGTSPKVWNAWKGKLLEDLYRLTVRAWAARARRRRRDRGAQARGAGQLALHALPFEAHKPLWDTLDVSYFMRHDAGDIAWHTRHPLDAEVAHGRATPRNTCIHRARAPVAGGRRPAGAGVHARPARPVRPHLRLLRPGGFHPGRQDPHHRNGWALDTFQVVTPRCPSTTASSSAWSKTELPTAIDSQGPLPGPAPGPVSRRVKSFPIAPARRPAADEKAQRWLLSITASDRVGLLYASPACWPATRSTCSWPRSPPWASGWKTPS